jgi:hypothetical protein
MPEMDGVEMVRELRRFEQRGMLNFDRSIIFALTALPES